MKKALKPYSLVLLAGILGGNSGCSSTPPTEVMSQAELAVSEASQGKAPQYAAADLNIARDRLVEAKRAVDSGRYTDARRFAEQALVDAQLAEAKAQAEQQRRTLEELRKSLEALKEETEQASDSR